MTEIERLARAAVLHMPGQSSEEIMPDALAVVRAILQAMREPSEGMVKAGRARASQGVSRQANRWQCGAAWTGIIDHILSESDK